MIDPAKAVVGIALDQRFPSPVPLSRLKAERVFHGSPLLRLPRLSLLPVMAAQWKLVNALSQ
jgi:predicted RNA-binding protein with PUA-like domain